MIKRYNSTKTNPFSVRKQASTVFNNGCLIVRGGTAGTYKPATNTSVGSLGIIEVGVTASDANYAATSVLQVDILSKSDVLECDVTTGTATTAIEGTVVDLNATGDGVNVSSSANGQIEVVKVISGTKVLGVLVK